MKIAKFMFVVAAFVWMCVGKMVEAHLCVLAALLCHMSDKDEHENA